MSWSDFVGLPHADLGRDRAGVDCYGLLRLVYAEDLGIDLPSFTEGYATCAEHARLAAMVAGESMAGPWAPVDQIQPYDALVFRVGRHDCHVAVAVDRTRMLHVHARSSAVIVSRKDPMWRDRFVRAHRHEAML
ncbi:C40 family peptidase [Salipiger bermudensis]|uniref:C40 family peptidase n=1 Tax=Salipiger bermudensis TaxID=344736 RepID=UPI001CD5AC37|nr:NlpC/P60 family protein [Salipiger bermudensis]MCA0963275.1 C40 family peptidase [Salipiger bermudensis]